MTSRADLIARAVISQFNKLPAKRKPAIRGNGLHEWVPLSGIVVEQDGNLKCLALATGMKCLPASKLPEANGNGLHDWHAEILAIRTFNRFLLDECKSLSESGARAGVLQHNETRGDASMELTMAAQDDASPWPAPTPSPIPNGKTSSLPGRAYFSHLGIVRRKPARGDAPPTLSKSCSDKFALKQCTSLLSSLASLFVDPERAYIDTLVLPASQHSAVACDRAFSSSGRMRTLAGAAWLAGYTFRPFAVETTTEEFGFSRRAVQARSGRISASNLAAAWSCSGVEESIVGGVIHGRKPFDQRGASRMSRRQMWTAAIGIARQLGGHDELTHHFSGQTYREVKDGPLLAQRRAVKAEVRETALAGWLQNKGDSGWGIDVAA
ncbi:tRNA-specific adenosine deaminase 1 [Tolypocladium ophioglossoides CBS 100239]|uniref:tRNA-specific adenosine deaminase 1 n=1 Tax=Tolypocladium ophioglossoides (strain CBS 100239) TaxID=1163406 RepID=A0A0L0MZT1_TOLOC|nr:tRNA-specific adenosine deaminase 1 [Tolypocladium ophioglossoides CBS 100239]